MPDTVTREIKEAIQQGFTKAQTAVTRHTAEIIGEELGNAIDDVKKLTGAALMPIKGAFKAITGDKISKGDKKRNSLLQQMVEYFHRQEKAAQRAFDPKEKKSPWYRLVVGLGLLVGAIAGKLLLPFTLLFEALKKLPGVAKIIDKMKSFFRRVMGFSKLVDSPIFKKIKGSKIAKFFARIVNFFRKLMAPVLKTFKFAGTKLPFLKTFFSAFKTGFKFLAWPLQIILSTIDFIKGFVSTEGTLLDKIIGGLWGAIEGFLDLPVKLIGWAVDWILKQFGIQIEGGAGNAIMEGIKSLFFMIVEGYKLIGQFISDAIKMAVDWVGKKFKEWGVVDALSTAWEKTKEIFGKAIGFVADGFWILVDMFKGFVNWLPSWIPGAKALKEEVGKWESRPEKSPTQTIDEANREKQRIAEREAARRRQKEEEEQKQKEKDREEQKRANDIQVKTNMAIANQNNNRGAPERENIPDQSENNLIGLAFAGS